MVGVAAAWKTAPVTAQVFEPAFAQVGGAQSVSPARGEGKEGQQALELEVFISSGKLLGGEAAFWNEHFVLKVRE